MLPRGGEPLGWSYFDSVQEFWDSEELEKENTWVERDRFGGRLQKAVAIDQYPRKLKLEDLELGIQPNTLMILNLVNLDCSSNYCLHTNPRPRTGKLDSFMDEVEEVAIRAGCRFVYIKSVFNNFLPEKFKRRGYLMIPVWPDRPNFIKVITKDQ